MRNYFDMSGRVAMVTGAGSGLGASFALALAEAGATVILAARRMDKLEQTRTSIESIGGTAHCVALDVTKKQSVDDCFHELDGQGLSVDCLVNNAGISREEFLGQMPEADWDDVFDTNIKGVFLVAQAVASRMIVTESRGSVVNVASILGFRPSKTLGAYCAAKAAVVRLTESQALEWARYGIRVNAIAPGYFSTEMNSGYLESPQAAKLLAAIPQHRIGDLKELNAAMLLLASGAGSYMNGSTIVVDGGLLLGGLS